MDDGRIDLGLMIFPTEHTISVAELGREAEERGFESLWLPEHSHIPVSRLTPMGGKKGAGPLPDYYSQVYDAFIALTVVATVTKTLRLGTSVCLVAQHDPIWLAKQISTLDHFSNGRFCFGVGYGWNKEEMADHGVSFETRRDRLRENVLAMQALWTHDEAAFEGSHVSLSPSWQWPKPVQRPHPPVFLGGSAGPRTAAQIAEFCDGWLPNVAKYDFESGLANIRKACGEIGREPASVQMTAFYAKPTQQALDHLAAAGVSRALIVLPQGDRDVVLPALDKYARLLAR